MRISGGASILDETPRRRALIFTAQPERDDARTHRAEGASLKRCGTKDATGQTHYGANA